MQLAPEGLSVSPLSTRINITDLFSSYLQKKTEESTELGVRDVK